MPTHHHHPQCPIPPTPQAWQPDTDGWLATGGRDGRVHVYDVTAGLALKEDGPLLCMPGSLGVTDGAMRSGGAELLWRSQRW